MNGDATTGESGPVGREYDAVVVGGGHNGLVNGAYLARGGLRTLVLEQRDVVGGAAITEELLPGYRFTTFSYALSLLRPHIVEDLDLVRHGFQPLAMPARFSPGEDGDHLYLTGDPVADEQEVRRRNPADVAGMARLDRDLADVCRLVTPLVDAPPPRLSGGTPQDAEHLAWVLGRLGDAGPRVTHNLVRLLTGSAVDFLDGYVQDELLRAWLAASGIIGSMVGPMSQGSGLILLFHHLGTIGGPFGAWTFHKGGNGGFTQVLARAAAAQGCEIRTAAPVERVLVRDGRVTGVALTDGTEITARIVVSALDPRRTFTELVDPAQLPGELVEDVARLKFRGSSAKVNFALAGLPRRAGVPHGPDHFRGFVNIGPSVEYLERAFDAAKYGWFSERPYLDCCVQSVVDPDMAPPGRHVMSCFVQYAPYRLKGGDWDSQRVALGDTVQATLESFFPGFGDLVVHREVVTPLDIERTVGLTEGNIFAGEMLAPQMYMFRPSPGWSDHRTPIQGYYQCGSGTHPGGCVSGGPGWLAAQRVLGDLSGDRGATTGSRPLVTPGAAAPPAAR